MTYGLLCVLLMGHDLLSARIGQHPHRDDNGEYDAAGDDQEMKHLVKPSDARERIGALQGVNDPTDCVEDAAKGEQQDGPPAESLHQRR